MSEWRYVSHQRHQDDLPGFGTVIMTIALVTEHRHWLCWWKTWTTEERFDVYRPKVSARWYWFEDGEEVPFKVWELCNKWLRNADARVTLEQALDQALASRKEA